MEAVAQPAPVHPVLEGRQDASEELADAVRRLISLTTATRAPEEDTRTAARDLNAIADLLEGHVPDPPLPKTIVHYIDGDHDLAGRMPFDVVVGRHNPLAIPLKPRFEPPKAFLEGVFTRPYEGPPGCVHGAVIASSFDIILAAANFISKASGPTARLEIFYRRPTLLDVPSVFEGWVEHQEERSVRTVGRLLQNGRVTVEAVGEFVRLDKAQMERLAGRAKNA